MGNVDFTEVIVPTVPEPEVSLPDEYERVRLALEKMQKKLIAADDRLIADRIHVGRPYTPSSVEYNPHGLDPVDVPEGALPPRDVHDTLGYHYGFTGRAEFDKFQVGLEKYQLTTRGGLEVSRFGPHSSGEFAWSNYEEADPDWLNGALEGLLAQHVALVADRKAHSVAGVTVPEVGS